MKKIEKEYRKYSSMSEDQLKRILAHNSVISLEKLQKQKEDEQIRPIIEKLEELNKQIEDMQKHIEYIKDLDEKAEKIKQLSSKIKERDNLFKAKAQKMKNVELEIKDIERQNKLVKGYLENKNKIEKIRNYKSRLVSKKEKLNQDKEKNVSNLENLNKRSVEIQKKLEKPEELDNFEYNDLLIEKEKVNEQIKTTEKKIKEIEKSLLSTSQAISKCDLAWKNLFVGKSWDEISIAAAKMGKEQSNNKDNKAEYKANSEQTRDVISTARELNKGEPEKEPKLQESEEKSIVKVSEFEQKHPRIAKFINWFKNRKNRRTEKTSNGKEITKEESIKEERDAFIEELRRYIENDKADKEAAYIEKHKAKVEKKEENENLKEEPERE